MPSEGAAAAAARAEVSAHLRARGHAVDNAGLAMMRLEAAFADGTLERTEAIDEALADLRIVLAHAEGQKLGGKSAEAARLIGRRLERLLTEA
jgi:hypothetical protein